MATAAANTAVATTLKLLGPSWTRAARCIWMLEELGLPFELIESATPWSKEVKQYQKTGKVPVLLEFDDKNAIESGVPSFVLTESAAINTYLGDMYAPAFPGSGTAATTDESPLLMPPPGTRERAHYDELVSCILTELDGSVWICRKHTDAKLSKFYGNIPEVTEPAQANFHRVNAVLAQKCQPYLLGPYFTPADILYVKCLDWAMNIQWDKSIPPDSKVQWPHDLLDPYLDLCRSRSAYQRTQQRIKQSAPTTKL